MSESQQERLDEPRPPEFSYTPLEFARDGAVSSAVVSRELDAWGLDPSWLGQQDAPNADVPKLDRYQYGVTYNFVTQAPGGKEYNPIEFRIFIYTVRGIPPAFKQDIRETLIGRLRELFDSGPYQGWIPGFAPYEKVSAVEDDKVAADEVNNLGIPQFEVRIEKGGSESSAGGFLDPFALFSQAPQQEEWDITKNPARETYEFRPQGRARQRMEDTQKQVYLNGKYIGNVSPSRGAVELKMEYSSNDNTWKNSDTGLQMWSRRKFIDQGLATAASVRKGGKVYKVNETESVVNLVATKPDDWNPTPPDEIPPEMAERTVSLEFSEDTLFDIRYDRGPLLGKYDAPTTRRIERETDFVIHETQPQ
jgi:hypothetical protein